MSRHGVSRLAWALAAAAAAINVLAYALSLYELRWFDEALHAFTLLCATFFAAHLLRDELPRHILPFVVVVLACGVAVGTLWELLEWAYDAYSATNVIRGKDDTMVDLLLDAAGALAAALVLVAMRAQSRSRAQPPPR